MWIIYHYNETVAAVHTLEAAEKIKRKINDPGKVKIIFER